MTRTNPTTIRNVRGSRIAGNQKRIRCVTSAVLLAAASLLQATALAAQDGTVQRSERAVVSQNSRFVGSWYLALDAEVFGAPPGSTLPVLIQIHSDRTLRIVDGGDFGGPPFTTRDLAQVGSWRITGRGRAVATALSLQADALTGEVQSWQKARLSLQIVDNDTITGTVNAFQLDCDATAPLPLLACPDPIAGADDFDHMPPFDIPIVLRRLTADDD